MASVLAMIVNCSPELPGAVCVDPAVREVFDRTTESTTNAVRSAATDACARCPVLAECRQWVEGLPPARRPVGVVGGLIVTKRARWSTGARGAPSL